ncbi:MAG: SRPBCC family protein [Halobacteria archaeon]|nr:SRPBCC family protein [Halobacteria archaeon]
MEFESETYIDAPLEDVWEFHSGVEGLKSLTPGWMNLRLLEVENGDADELTEGSEIRLSVKPLGLLRVSWTSTIVERESDFDEGRAVFVDEMERGPFERWRHTHGFERSDGGTVMRDTVEYESGKIPNSFVKLQLKGFFRYRHSKTKKILED